MTYRFTLPNGTTITEQNPNWVKMNPRYPSFICCHEGDAECVILTVGEEQVQHNLNIARYSEYETVTYTRLS